MKRTHSSRNGAMLVLILVVMVIFLVAAVFSVDIAQMHLARAELRTATDAAARAGTEALARTQDQDEAVNAALNAAAQNDVFGQGLQLRIQDITLGAQANGNNGKIDFIPNAQPFTSVEVIGDATSPPLKDLCPYCLQIFLESATSAQLNQP